MCKNQQDQENDDIAANLHKKLVVAPFDKINSDSSEDDLNEKIKKLMDAKYNLFNKTTETSDKS